MDKIIIKKSIIHFLKLLGLAVVGAGFLYGWLVIVVIALS